MLSRRGLLGSLFMAPAIIRPGLLMRIKPVEIVFTRNTVIMPPVVLWMSPNGLLTQEGIRAALRLITSKMLIDPGPSLAERVLNG